MATELFRVRLDEAIAEVERELRLRERFYAERVRDGRMSRLMANSQIGRLYAASAFLREFRLIKGGNYEGEAAATGGDLAR